MILKTDVLSGILLYAPQTSIVSTLLFNLFLNSRCTQFVGLDEGSVYILGWQGSMRTNCNYFRHARHIQGYYTNTTHTRLSTLHIVIAESHSRDLNFF